MAGKTISQYLADDQLTVSAGECLGRSVQSRSAANQDQDGGAVVFLQGDLGAGKTTFSRGVMRAFGHSGAVKSPTYTLVEPYDFDGRLVYHFDLYRLGDAEELEYMGIRDYFGGDSVCLVEWPSRGEGVLPIADLVVELQVQVPGRQLIITSQTPRGEQLASLMVEKLAEICA